MHNENNEQDSNRTSQNEELEVLAAIYGDDCTVFPEEARCTIRVPDAQVKIHALFPPEYPSHHPPVLQVEVVTPPGTSRGGGGGGAGAGSHHPTQRPSSTTPSRLHLHLHLPPLELETEPPIWTPDLDEELQRRIASWTPGEPIMFEIVQWVFECAASALEVREAERAAEKEAERDKQRAEEERRFRTREGDRQSCGAPCEAEEEEEGEGDSDEEGEAGRQHVRRDWSNQGSATGGPVVKGLISGELVTEKKSVFQAHLCPIASSQEVPAVMAAIMRVRKVLQATHNIMAFRVQHAGGVWVQDCDDDGETAAGGRLLHLLNMTQSTNVLVVVSRWYGGVKLGPQRFKVINNTARALLVAHGYVKT